MFSYDPNPDEQREIREWIASGQSIWKDNPHWMRHRGDPEPTHDPPEEGCESCCWLDESGDVRDSDLIWVTDAAWAPGVGMWLCMECD